MMESALDHDLQWNRRGKRSKLASPPPLNDLDEDEISVAEALVQLAYSRGGFCDSYAVTTPTPPKKRQELALFAAVDAVEIQSAAAAATPTRPKKRPELVLIAAVNAVEIQSAAAATPTPPQKRQELALIAAVSPKNQDGTSPDTPLMKYHNCRVCGQVFRSSRALGGHVTSHRAKTQNADHMRRRSSADASERVHECSFCHETFASGQALGGHKRKHYEGPALARKALKFTSNVGVAGETSRGGGDTSHVRPLFDLNLPAPEEE